MKVFVHATKASPVAADVEQSAVLADALGLKGGEKLWLEDSDEALGGGATAADLGEGTSASLHRGKGLVTVEVSYNGDSRHRRFGPGSTVDRVFEWAVSSDGFGLDAAAATDLVLRLTDSEDSLDAGTHIGSLVDKGEKLLLDLLPASRFAG